MTLPIFPRDIWLHISSFIEKEADIVRLTATCRQLRILLVPFLTTTPDKIQSILNRCFDMELHFTQDFLTKAGESKFKYFPFTVHCLPYNAKSIRAAVVSVLPQTVVVASDPIPMPLSEFQLVELIPAPRLLDSLYSIEIAKWLINSTDDNYNIAQRIEFAFAAQEPISIDDLERRLETLP